MKIKVLFFCVLLSACSSVKNTKNVENDLKRLNFKSNVASSRSWCYKAVSKNNSIEKGEYVYEYPMAENDHYYFDKDGHEYKYVLLGGQKDTLWHFKSHYNKLAKKNESISVSIGKSKSYHFYKYDNEYNCVEELTKDKTGENSSLHQFVYNKEKNSIVEKHFIFKDGKQKIIDYSEEITEWNVRKKQVKTYYDINDKVTSKNIFYFDEKNNFIIMESFNPNGYIDSKITRDFDEKGNEIEFVERNFNSGQYITKVSKYDEFNNVVWLEEYKTYEKKRNIWTFTYELNIKNDWVKQVVYKNDIPTYIIEREIAYY